MNASTPPRSNTSLAVQYPAAVPQNSIILHLEQKGRTHRGTRIARLLMLSVPVLFLTLFFPVPVCGKSGDLLWAKTYGLDYWREVGRSLAVTPDGDIYLAEDGFLIHGTPAYFSGDLKKFDSRGSYQWGRDFGKDAKSVLLNDDGTVFVVGSVGGPIGCLPSTIGLSKYSPYKGRLLWHAAYEGLADFRYLARRAAKKGAHIYVVGTRELKDGPLRDMWAADIVLLKYGRDGDLVWTRIFNARDTVQYQPEGIALGPRGFVYICGVKTSPSGDKVGIVQKYSRSGRLVWTRIVGSQWLGMTRCADLTVSPDGMVYVVGSNERRTKPISYSLWIRKISWEGQTQWTLFHPSSRGPGAPFAIHGVALKPGGGVYFAGKEDWQVLLGECDTQGRLVWEETYRFSNQGSDGYGLAVDPEGNLLATGVVYGQGQKGDILLMKVRR